MVPKTTQAAVLRELNADLIIRTINIPDLMPGQVLVKVLFSGVCRSQLMEVMGGRGEDPWLPHLLGHEGCGEVLAVGEGVSKVQPGDQVIITWIKADGMVAPGAIYDFDGESINSGRVTTFSRHSIVSECCTVPLPEGVPPKVGVLFGCALLTGAGIVLNELMPDQNHVVAVIGLGGVGLSALIALKNLDVKRIIAVDQSEAHLELARAFGACETVNSALEDVEAWFATHVPNGLDACVEAAGTTATIELGFRLVRKGGGRLYFASHPPSGERICLDPHDLISGKSIHGSWGGACHADQDIAKIADTYLSGNMPLEKLIEKEYSLHEINKALMDLKNGEVFRPIINMEHSY